MTSVPKPFKFLAPHYAALKTLHEGWAERASPNASRLADLLSVLAMTMGTGPCESLALKLRGDTADLDSWGHEYVRALAGEVGTDWGARQSATPPGDLAPLRALVDRIVPFQMSHNAEVEVSPPPPVTRTHPLHTRSRAMSRPHSGAALTGCRFASAC
jgi:26S proteasome regulatory subunit N1